MDQASFSWDENQIARDGTEALGDEYHRWFVGLLRTFGSTIWVEAATAVEQTLDRDAVRRLLATADADQPEVAAFFARHCLLFRSDDADLAAALDVLLAHPDWRVRAGGLPVPPHLVSPWSGPCGQARYARTGQLPRPREGRVVTAGTREPEKHRDDDGPS